MRLKRPALAMTMIAAVGAVGCSESLTVRSQPAGATVYIDGVKIGETPLVYRTRNVRPLSYKVEKAGYPSAGGNVTTAVAPGRVVGAIFTLGIVAMARPMRAFVPRVIDEYLGPDGKPAEPTARISLYNRADASVITGECETETGYCWVTLADGQRCEGEFVRETRGTTSVHGARGRAVSAGFVVDSAAAAAATEVDNMSEGVAAFRCPGWVAECTLVVGAFSAEGYGECEDSDGKQYKLMMRPKRDTRLED